MGGLGVWGGNANTFFAQSDIQQVVTARKTDLHIHVQYREGEGVVADLIFASGFYRESYIHEKVVDDNRIHLRRSCLRERRTEGGEGDGMHAPQSIQERLLTGIHSIMRVKLAQAGEGGGCTPTPFHYIYHHQ